MCVADSKGTGAGICQDMCDYKHSPESYAFGADMSKVAEVNNMRSGNDHIYNGACPGQIYWLYIWIAVVVICIGSCCCGVAFFLAKGRGPATRLWQSLIGGKRRQGLQGDRVNFDPVMDVGVNDHRVQQMQSVDEEMQHEMPPQQQHEMPPMQMQQETYGAPPQMPEMQQQLLPQQQCQGRIQGLDQPTGLAPNLFQGSYTVQPAQAPETTAQVASPELIAAAQQQQVFGGYGYGQAAFPTVPSQQTQMLPLSPGGAYRTTMMPQPQMLSQPAYQQAYTTQPMMNASRPGSMNMAPGQVVQGGYYPMQ